MYINVCVFALFIRFCSYVFHRRSTSSANKQNIITNFCVLELPMSSSLMKLSFLVDSVVVKRINP